MARRFFSPPLMPGVFRSPITVSAALFRPSRASEFSTAWIPCQTRCGKSTPCAHRSAPDTCEASPAMYRFPTILYPVCPPRARIYPPRCRIHPPRVHQAAPYAHESTPDTLRIG
eukprot:109515-Prorocentrum_minimum.AAC.4